MESVTLTPEAYDYHKANYDGICKMCKNFSFSSADPKANNVWCDQCENKSVFGMKAALDIGLVEVR